MGPAPPKHPAPASCIFCEIAQHKAPAYIVYEDTDTMGFLDIYPFTRGHLLIIPKRHGTRLTDLPFTHQTSLLRTVDLLCRRSERLTSDYNVALNAGANAGQIVFHVHFHLIPRYGEPNPFLAASRAPLQVRDAQELVATLSAP
jgi:histidine triad (HIT) family protein